ncbi:hypothetical protein AVEN_233769-1 [Araneus ventricosus]|uniref:Uncharacterized protein n=1 Tax=Araneus ventricosus TaxID=182803 RepID=A0A4Y2QI32_ARAVE|nr:hypothetical protein AVEN_233769-1 [Araneus ventricosus]
MHELISSSFLVVVPFFAETEVTTDREVIVKIEIRLFAGIIVVSEKTANLKNAFSLAIFKETKTAKNRRDMFFAADITSPDHSRPDIKDLLSGRHQFWLVFNPC